MEEKISLAESQRQWRILLKRKIESDSLPPQQTDTTTTTTATSKANGSKDEQVVVDPFDCSDLRIPSVTGLVDETAALWIQEWKDLDERKIVASGGPRGTNENTNHQNSKTNDASAKEDGVATRKRPYWLDQHVRLPEGFDYATRHDGPPPDNDHNNTTGNNHMMTMMSEDRVLSLEDPTKTTSYHAELWKLFASIPTAKQLEQDAVAGMRLPHSSRLRTEMMDEKNKLKDLFGLCRLRMSDRHCYPSSPVMADTATATSTTSSNQPDEQTTSPPPASSGSIVLECWRRQPKRGSTPDSSRAVLEFLGSQTLYDVHCALVDLAEDEFWKQVVVDDESITTTTNKKETDEESGMFFIENAFYTTGSVDYVTSIQQWLNAGNTSKARNRALAFGLDTQNLARPVRSVAETRLDELEMRLGVRYLHVHHGNVECSVFLVDRQYSCTGSASTTSSFPLLHDVWTPTYSTPDCEACSSTAAGAASGNGRGRPASMVTSTECAMTDGHRALCLDCARQLAASSRTRTSTSSAVASETATTDTPDSATTSQRKKPKLLLQPLTVWRSQADLTTDAYGDKGF